MIPKFNMVKQAIFFLYLIGNRETYHLVHLDPEYQNKFKNITLFPTLNQSHDTRVKYFLCIANIFSRMSQEYTSFIINFEDFHKTVLYDCSFHLITIQSL